MKDCTSNSAMDSLISDLGLSSISWGGFLFVFLKWLEGHITGVWILEILLLLSYDVCMV